MLPSIWTICASSSKAASLNRQQKNKIQNPTRQMVPILFPLLLLLSSVSPSASDSDNVSPTIFLSVCGRTETQTPGPFDVQFVGAMEKIFVNITTDGFATSSSSSGNLTVYGLGQCFSYLSPINCQLCYSESRVKLPHCLPATAGRIFLDGCFLEYSDRNISADSVDPADAYSCSNDTVSDPNFVRFTEELVQNLTAAASRAKDYYAVGSAAVAPGLTAYAMAQCWSSLNATGCKGCLEKGRQSVVDQCLPAAADDGKSMNAGCFLRYSTEPFYLLAAGDDGGGGSSARRTAIITVTTILGAVLLVGMGFLIWRTRRSDYRHGHDDTGENHEIIRSITKSHLSFKHEDLSKATNDFSQSNKLGQGGYGAVYKGILLDGKEIAVKRLFFNTRNWVDQFFNEVTLISQVQHKNLVKLLGCSVEGPESLLVYEFLSNTSLDHHLFDSFKKAALNWEIRLEIIVGTAEGLAYLHNSSVVRIIHRDIKASNILLDEKFRAKISDFGLARCFAEDQSHLSTGLAGTFGYMAPEYIVHGQLTEKADIYSYGVLVLEILTGQKNQNSISNSAEGHSLMQQIWQHYNSDELLRLLDPDLVGKYSEEDALKVFKVGLLCVQASPTLRPPMWKVVEMLGSRSNELPIPTQPPFLNTHGVQRSTGSDLSQLQSTSVRSPELGDQNENSVNEVSVSIFQGR